MTDQQLDELLKAQKIELTENQRDRLSHLYGMFENDPNLNWGKHEIFVENDVPKIRVTFVLS